MTSANEFHLKAMEIAEEGIIARLKGDMDTALKKLKEAYEIEKKAVDIVMPMFDNEPTRSIMTRSAAALAMDCGEFREAEKMTAIGLMGNPPLEIAEEMRNIYEQVNFKRHMELKGITLDGNEIQLSLAGPEISKGLAGSEELLKRLDAIEKITLRTAERKSGLPFREKGSTSKEIRENFKSFVSIPRAASFAVTIRFGRPLTQKPLFSKFGTTENIIDDIMHNLELINTRKEKKLKEEIKDENYYTNLLGFSRVLAPDGERIKLVGLTVCRDGKENHLALSRAKEKIDISPTSEEVHEEKYEKKTVTGTLTYADAQKKKIKLIEENGKSHSIIVPSGLSDIVKPYWEESVIITGKVRKNKNLIYLEFVEKA